MGAKARSAPAAAPGLVLDNRYRLEQVRTSHGGERIHSVLWRARDEVLDRRVAVRLVTGLNRTDTKRVLASATKASQVKDSRFVRVLDVGEIDLAEGRTCWIATEWVDGPSLAALVRGEPLAPPVATDVIRQCAEAVAALDREGLRHGRLHPDQVIVPADGQLRITGLAVAAALSPEGESNDTQALGGLLFAALTGRWPLPGWTGLPAPDARAARQARPRLVRAGISQRLDDVAHAALTGEYAEPRRVARALDELPARPLNAPPAAPPAPGTSLLNRWAWRVVPPALVVAIGIAGWAIGSDLGRIPTSAQQPRAALPPARAAAPGAPAARLVWRRPPAITSFDPEGDGTEDPGAVGFAVDRDPTTVWTTDVYRGDPHFGGLKSGVGLLVDLQRPVSVRLAELALAPAGATVELRAGNNVPAQASDLPLVASRADAGVRTRLTLARPVRARYWLVWFTALPPVGHGFQVGVAELALLG